MKRHDATVLGSYKYRDPTTYHDGYVSAGAITTFLLVFLLYGVQ